MKNKLIYGDSLEVLKTIKDKNVSKKVVEEHVDREIINFSITITDFKDLTGTPVFEIWEECSY